MINRKSRILGTGMAVPERIVTNFDMEKLVETTDEWIRTRTGISERRFADGDVTNSSLSIQASEMALKNAGITADQIDLIIVATITPDMVFPATACIVQDKIGATKAAAFDLEAACSGFLYGLAVADRFIASGMYKYALVIGTEVMSKIIDIKDRNTCVLFGDGSGAVVVGPSEDDSRGLLGFDLGSDGAGGKYLYMPAGGSEKPATHETVEAREHFLKMEGKEVFKFAVRVMENASLRAIENSGLSFDEIDFLVPHQANERIILAAAKRLQLPMEKVQVNLDKYGNMSAASIPVALHEAVTQGKLNEGDHVVMVGFGGGLTWGATVMKW
ncbi:beta-ketoacyl-ACP synthase III [Acidaminobacter hydrogenoformans]|uniref:Beta-ketoacyl-[acyl-carrier-protein] synthase III n=1 Tax=Acidaminobacter hydrogenoformans DSM 2784 TaxID=1120920 RepID=A0A1G5RS46_9FIRM|nr:beta-ketoacyl-ACP synthase III [Acidaminobacter hydrogenoformans]SCZ76925.1 3-oxoacyl-[acyl-carrier-protein] synthase-3 [Acidaminobacter hydrogenoformans DSM 2784]